MNLMKTAIVSCAVLMIGACTYSKTTTTRRYEGGQDPQTGVYYLEITDTVENLTITIEADSVKELVSQIPEMDSGSKASEMITVRYEYRIDVHDIYGNYVGTVSVRTLSQALELIPDLFTLGGLSVPPAAELEELEDDLAANWISPQTHWNLYH